MVLLALGPLCLRPPRLCPQDPPPPPEPAAANEPLGPNLFPLFLHERRAADDTEVLQVLGLFTKTWRPDGGGSTLLLPFFYSHETKEPPDQRLYVLPLYFERESPEVSFQYLLPFFFRHRTLDLDLKLVLPVWLRLGTDEGKLVQDHILFPLFRSQEDRRLENRPVEATRLGLWRVLELWESRSTPTTRELAGLHLLNFGTEAERGFIPPLFAHTAVEEPGAATSSTYLFPFYWRGVSPGSEYLWTFPLFGYWSGEAQEDLVLPFLLSRVGWGDRNSLRLDLAFPLAHYARSDTEFSIASYLFFDYHRSSASESLGLLLLLYRQYSNRETDTSTRMVLFPLSYWQSRAGGTEGVRWVFPYFELFDKDKRVQVVAPLLFRHEKRSEGETKRFVTVALPSYLSFGTPTDYFSTGFPFYWAKHEVDHGFSLLLPFFYSFYSVASSDFHLVPLFSQRSFPGEKQYYFLGPLYVLRRYFDLQDQPSGSGHSFLWPLSTFESHERGYHYHLLPFFWVEKDEGTENLLVTPFYFQRRTPTGTFRYLFPLYARQENQRERRDFYAAGSVVTYEARGDDGEVWSSGLDLLWWLASFHESPKTGSSHQHILPLLYWRTVEPAEKLSIAGPLFISHTSAENDEVRSLDLYLGNFFVDSQVRSRIQRPAAPEPARSGDSVSAVPAPAGAMSAGGELFAERSRERGVLWPLSRWWRDDHGSEGEWVLPFYFRSRTETAAKLGLFPFFYSQRDSGGYEPNYFRYFVLFNTERWAGGKRLSLGQLLLDWTSDEQREEERLSVLFPLFEFAWSAAGSSYQLTQLIAGERTVDAGQRRRANRVVPVFWEGSEERLSASGEWIPQGRHFYFLPFFGYESRITDKNYYVLFPFFHLGTSTDTLGVELLPFFFYERNPALEAFRIWPFASFENGELAGDFWLTDFLFLSKQERRPQVSSYRLDPFIFRVSSERADDGSTSAYSFAALGELIAYQRSPTSTSFRAIPFVFGTQGAEGETSAFIPFHYRRAWTSGEIDYLEPWRFFFFTSSLRGPKGERHFSVLTKLFEYSDNPSRPDYHETRLLERVVLDSRSETTRRFELNPFFQYYHNSAEDRTELSFLLSIFSRQTKGNVTRHRLFWLLEF